MTTETEAEKIEIKQKNYLSFILKKMKKEGNIDQIYNKLKSYKIDLNNKPAINKFILEELIITPEVVKKKRTSKTATKKAAPAEPSVTDIITYEIKGRYDKYRSLANPKFIESYSNLQKNLTVFIDEHINSHPKTLEQKFLHNKLPTIYFRVLNYLRTKLLSDIVKVLQSDKWNVHPIEITKLSSYDTQITIPFSLKNDVIITYSNPSTKKFVTKNFGKFTIVLYYLIGSDGHFSFSLNARTYSNNTFCLVDDGVRYKPVLKDNHGYAVSVHPYMSNVYLTYITKENQLDMAKSSYLHVCFGNLEGILFNGKDAELNIPRILFMTYNLLHVYDEGHGPYTLIDSFRTVPDDFRLRDSEICKEFNKNMENVSVLNLNNGILDLINVNESLKFYDTMKNAISSKLSSNRVAKLLPIPRSGDGEIEEEFFEEEDEDE